VIDAINYFEGQWRPMPSRQKGGVIGAISQIIDQFSVEPFREMMSGCSTISEDEVVDTGKIFYVDQSAAERPYMAKFITCLIKLKFQNAILRRPNKHRPSWFICDEFPVFWTSGDGRGDADLFALSRGSRHSNIVAAQNISAFYRKSDNKDEARNFLGNCATKIFLRNTETETNEWASRLIGEKSMITVGANESAGLDEPLKRGFTTYSRSTASTRLVPPEAFAELAIPVRGDPRRQYSESIVHLASRETTQTLNLTWRVNPL
jgi:type IV secretory pathway TraG/TraD family ATPase VirD4